MHPARKIAAADASRMIVGSIVTKYRRAYRRIQKRNATVVSPDATPIRNTIASAGTTAAPRPLPGCAVQTWWGRHGLEASLALIDKRSQGIGGWERSRGSTELQDAANRPLERADTDVKLNWQS
jgi:transposase InsO family protein